MGSALEGRLPHHEGLPDDAVIAQGHQRKQTFLDALGACHAMGDQRGGLAVQHQEVGLLAGLELPNWSAKRKALAPPRVAR